MNEPFDLKRAQAGERFFHKHSYTMEPLMFVKITSAETVLCEDSGGRGWALNKSDLKMLPREPERRVMWVNVYAHGEHYGYNTKEKAEASARGRENYLGQARAIFPEPKLTDELVNGAITAYRQNPLKLWRENMRDAIEFALREMGYME